MDAYMKLHCVCSKFRHNCIRNKKNAESVLFIFFPLLCYIRTTKEAYLYDWFYHCKHCNS